MARQAAVIAVAGVPRVDLMPRIELDRRARAGVTVGWMWGILASFVVVGLVAAGAYGLQMSADARLAAEQERSNSLIGDLSALADVSTSLGERHELEDFRSSAMGADLGWDDAVSSLREELPEGVVMTGFDLTSGVAPQPGADDSSAPGLTGTLSLRSATPIEIADAVRALRTVGGVLAADGREVRSTTADADDDTRTYAYLVTLTLDRSVYSGQFAPGEQTR